MQSGFPRPKSLALSLLAAALTAISCEVHHLTSDAEYRQQVENDLEARFSRYETLSQFYQVDRDAKKLGDAFLTTEEVEALDFLYAYMPLADLTDHPTEYHLQNVQAALKAEAELGWEVPERLFRHFVLPVRVNNENLDTSRTAFYRELKPRVEGRSMKDAILEVNHWCHEKLTYHPSDARTLSPLAAASCALGRCGEEATFTVAALRAVGIPARQVYTPRWAHTDDNHAWVEAWADGEWWFLGACEPEPVLNLGWFNAPASRGMLMHTKVFGRYDGPEETVLSGPNFTEVNLIDNYAETARVDLTVVGPDGEPVDSALVDFKIYNYAEFYPALSKYTGEDGKTFLTAGLGDMLVWASKGGLHGYVKVSFGKDKEVQVRIGGDRSTAPRSFLVVPPPENVALPEVTPEQRAANDLRFAQENLIRKAYVSTFRTSDGSRAGELVAGAAGNHRVISQFLEDNPGERALELLESLSDKDLKDVTREILDDSYLATSSILCPRVENEYLSPYKSFFLESLTEETRMELSDPVQLLRWMDENIEVVNDPKAWNIPMSPEGVFRSGLATPRSRDIFFVALARTLGLDARKDPVTGKIQYAGEWSWIDVDFDNQTSTQSPKGTLVLNYAQSGFPSDPGYYTNFTVSKLENGRTVLQTFDEGEVDMGGGVSWETSFKYGSTLDAGDYILVSGNRLSDGSVPVSVQEFSIRDDEETVLDLIISVPEGKLPVIGSFDSETLYSKTPGSEPVSILSTTGRGFYVLGCLEPEKEPSVHAVNDLIAAADKLQEWGGTILLLTSEKGLQWLESYMDKLPSNVRTGIAPASIREGRSLPYFILADTFNRVFFTSEGYTIGLGDRLVGSLDKL